MPHANSNHIKIMTLWMDFCILFSFLICQDTNQCERISVHFRLMIPLYRHVKKGCQQSRCHVESEQKTLMQE
jgi:hypothetical protein